MGMGMALFGWERLDTLQFTISHLEQANKPTYVVPVLLEERSVLDIGDPIYDILYFTFDFQFFLISKDFQSF